MFPRFSPSCVRGDEPGYGGLFGTNQDIRVDDKHLSVRLFALRDALS
jgi:hypothetical protein